MADDDKKSDDKRRADEERRKADEQKTASQQALVPDAEGNVAIDVIMGPYRDQRLTMTAADGQAAIDAHWARDPHSGVPYGEGHEPLDDEHRAEALEAANTWAQTQWDAGTQEPPPEGGEGETGGVTRRRAMTPDKPAQNYTTRQTPPAEPRKP